MAQFTRLDVLNRTLEVGVVPIYYHGNAETVCQAMGACAEGGLTLFEFTNRGDHAIDVFGVVVRHARRHLPRVMVGAGSIVDEATAALFAAQGADFVVGPVLSEAVARFCNRRKLAYLPGCATLTEISAAEEWGVEIVKLFPCETAGGPAFLKAILGPCPWTRLMPTGLSVLTRESVGAWLRAGAAALGIGRALLSPELVAKGDYPALARRAAEIAGWVREARA
jgi:2-dehydro-3-deoxyphosphogluconate aldolase/(4S)-4-hydroxy-2-oxoglutarate aldolase